MSTKYRKAACRFKQTLLLVVGLTMFEYTLNDTSVGKKTIDDS